MKNDNRGFTLIELMISMVIFAILVTSVFGFMLASSRSYNKINDRLNLDTESQITLNLLSSYVMNCDSYIYFNTGTSTLYVLSKGSSDTTCNVSVFSLTTGYIYYGYKADGATLSGTTFSCTAAATDRLAQNVTGFSVATSDGALVTTTTGSKVTSATVTITFANGTATASRTMTIALRNKPTIAALG